MALEQHHLLLVTRLSAIPRPTTLHFRLDPLLEDAGRWPEILSNIRASKQASQIFTTHFVLSNHAGNHDFSQYETDIPRWLRRIDEAMYLAGPKSTENLKLYDYADELRLMLVDALHDLAMWKRDIWISQRNLRDSGSGLPPTPPLSSAVCVDTGAVPFSLYAAASL